ncbi:hypothetical protein HanPSC8_Chr08g0348331 [Helianthus annuus]|nr:hypothetical protein HanPSC8_Chr08g0348331 [Helianthus annuus]
MWKHVTSFAAPIIVSLFRLSINRYEILFKRTCARFVSFVGSRGKVPHCNR